jgi:hypothetical protein
MIDVTTLEYGELITLATVCELLIHMRENGVQSFTVGTVTKTGHAGM